MLCNCLLMRKESLACLHTFNLDYFIFLAFFLLLPHFFLGRNFCRFSYEGRWKQKLQTSVDFSLDTLDLSQYVIGPKQNLKRYSLYGVSVSSSEIHLDYFFNLLFEHIK